MWISADESEVVSATLLPKLQKTWRAHQDLLFEAITLQVCIPPLPSFTIRAINFSQQTSFDIKSIENAARFYKKQEKAQSE